MRVAISLPPVAFLAIFLARASSKIASGIIDPDYYWHLGYGEWILEHGRLPTTDFWSWTVAGHPYRLTQWLGEVTMALANRAAGELGTQALSAALTTLTVALSYRAARFCLDNRLAALSVAIGSNAILISLPCRPHQFTHLALAMTTALLAQYDARGSRDALVAIPLLMALWVNLHGGYAVGLAYLWLIAALGAVAACIEHTPAGIGKKALPLALAAGAGTLATLANPYGIGAWSYALEIAALKSSSAGIVDEWGATSIKTEVGLHFLLVTSVLFAAMAASRERPRPQALLAAFALTAVGWWALRLSLMVTVLLVPLTARALRGTAFYQLAFGGTARRYDGNLCIPVAALVLVLAVATQMALSRGDPTAAYLADNLPQQEVQFMKRHGIAGRLMNNPEAGGYLIRNLGQKIFLDTRLDLYGDRALFEFLFARRGESGWREYVRRFDPDVVVIDNIAPLRELLTATGMYRLIFEGHRYSVLVRPQAYPELPTLAASRERSSLLDRLKT